MTINPADYLVHFSNILLLVSYSVRDILWLRWFAVAAALTNMPYFLLQGTILWPPILWAAVFTAINLFQIARIYLERRPVVLSKDEQALYDLGFKGLRPREFLSLALFGEWKDAAAGDKVITEGEPVSCLCIPISGTAEVRRQGQPLGAFRPGHIIGTALALTGSPSTVEATFTEPGRYMRWPLESLRAFMDKRPELRSALQTLVNRDLAGKVEGLTSSAR
ncbi:MAG TPA: cyclic nucleotide-binding domain-containing protein [Steroidobacteraceae bacterium]|jgi:CRP-like cAMP-binding protein|nr:cyclic nucleotide-binding domain-containing protein [Steroidobacteraceae bacterium]